MFSGERLNAKAAIQRSSGAEKQGVVQFSDLWPIRCFLHPNRKYLSTLPVSLLNWLLTPTLPSPWQWSFKLTSSGLLSLQHLLYWGCKHVLTPKETTEGRSFASTHAHRSSLLNNLFHYSDPDSSIKAVALNTRFNICSFWLCLFWSSPASVLINMANTQYKQQTIEI